MAQAAHYCSGLQVNTAELQEDHKDDRNIKRRNINLTAKMLTIVPAVKSLLDENRLSFPATRLISIKKRSFY